MSGGKTISQAGLRAVQLAGERRIGLGCMALTGIYGAVGREQAVGVLHEALDCGVTFFDSAPLYANGANEELLGHVLGSKTSATIVTKFGLYAGHDGKLHRDSRPKTIKQSVESSLRRLKRERIDFLLQHRSDPAVPFDAVLGAIEDLIAQGKVAEFGLSNLSADEIAGRMEVAQLAIIQNELSFATGAKADEVAATEAAGAVYMAFSPLGRGLLTGSIAGQNEDLRRSLPAFMGSAAKRNHELGVVARSARSEGKSVVRFAIDWVLSQGRGIVAIPGCRSASHVREIFAFC